MELPGPETIKLPAEPAKLKPEMPPHNMKLPYDKNQASIYATQTTAPALRYVCIYREKIFLKN